MDCPICHSPMIEGAIASEVGNVDLAVIEDLLLGSGHAAGALFRAQDGTTELINFVGGQPAFRCAACSLFLIITDPEYTDTECLVCKTAMPAGITSGPKCGWTYKVA